MHIEMVNKRYEGMSPKYKYNPIPLNDERSRNMFSNIETQYVYSENDRMWEDGDIRRHVYWYRVSYKKYKEDKGGDEYKNIEYTKVDREEYGNDIPECVCEIGTCCFSGCLSLSSISIPSSVSVIGDECFEECSSLSSISVSLKNLESGITKLGVQWVTKFCYSIFKFFQMLSAFRRSKYSYPLVSHENKHKTHSL